MIFKLIFKFFILNYFLLSTSLAHDCISFNQAKINTRWFS